MERVKGRPNRENLAEAFTIAETELGIPRLLDPEGKKSHCWFLHTHVKAVVFYVLKAEITDDFQDLIRPYPENCRKAGRNSTFLH